MRAESFLRLFPSRKPVIGMIHMGKLEGQVGFTGEKDVIALARHDLHAWQKGGVDGLIFENWQEDAITPYIPAKRVESMGRVIEALRNEVRVPFGINVLNNDYPAAYKLSTLVGASFIQLDVLVDRVVSDFIYNDAAKQHPFFVEVKNVNIKQVARRRGLTNLPLLAGIHPKHYRLLDAQKTLEQSAFEANRRGVAGIVITKATGQAPFYEAFERVRSAVDTPVGIGSGLTPENAEELLAVSDFAIVGTYAKVDGITNNPVDVSRVKHLMRVVRKSVR